MLNQYRLDEYGDVLSPKDVHDILGIGYNKTYELLKTGAIKNFKIGRERKIPKHCLENYINSMLEQADYCDT
ncbi:MAG: helix-turn-helix domain-containing protein [Clostridia bacterium]|nr:helix-turn-helix domain-containing protein [Clostridia bacterium]